MKLIRLQIPGNFLKHVGFENLFEYVDYVDILNAFQYDQKHFFTLQRIKVNIKDGKSIKNFILEKFNPQSFQLLDHRGDEIICIMDQNREKGFFPIFDSGPWALLFPIHVSKDVVLVNIISQNNYVNNLFDILSSFTENYKILGMMDLNNINQIDEDLWKISLPFPKFTKKQEEIASYATKMGFFKTPKQITAEEIAKHFNISESAVNKHLRKVISKAMEYFFGRFL